MKIGVRSGAVVLALGLFGTATALAAGPTFLQIDGIDGESTEVHHKGEIEVLSFSWGVSQPATGARAFRATRAPLRSLTIVKRIDKASPKLFQARATGVHIPKVTLASSHVRYELHDVIISSYRNGGATESVAFSYGSMQQVPVMMSPAPATALVKTKNR